MRRSVQGAQRLLRGDSSALMGSVMPRLGHWRLDFWLRTVSGLGLTALLGCGFASPLVRESTGDVVIEAILEALASPFIYGNDQNGHPRRHARVDFCTDRVSVTVNTIESKNLSEQHSFPLPTTK